MPLAPSHGRPMASSSSTQAKAYVMPTSAYAMILAVIRVHRDGVVRTVGVIVR